MIHTRIMLMRLNDASKKSFETGHANLYIFPFFFLLLVGTFTKRREHRKFVNVVILFMCGPAKRFRSVSDYNNLSLVHKTS